MYTGLLYHTIDVALLTFNWVLVIGYLLVVVTIFSRIPNEENMMITLFGNEYRDY